MPNYATSSTESSKENTKNLYFAGPLFNHPELIGNRYLAEAIEEKSAKEGKYKYKCTLPQDLEQDSPDAKKIKDNDLRCLKTSDGGLFNFNGVDQDSGTVVEYMANIYLRHPTVIYRTDFRAGGNNNRTEKADPWNLMLSNYPHVEVVVIDNIMGKYQNALKEYQGNVDEATKALSLVIAEPIIEALDKAFDNPPPLPQGFTLEMIGEYFDTVNGLDLQ
ncbi:nucleoside 2-deoxyribosyltransferase [Candidatus Tisiphia endosymbiont of Nedyus quadrimaculatus]|uniref:nucleoside 2-deoxyribosyltransferase n=1 Tax=Candidatus Tisiphia endosymbiont of Nedyus quadrimaculatus TaxID=3139332 RepID=UPI00345F1066